MRKLDWTLKWVIRFLSKFTNDGGQDRKYDSPLKTLTMEDMIKYPPAGLGIPMFDVDRIYTSQLELIEEIRMSAGLANDPDGDSSQWVEMYEQVIKNYIQYVALIPASENHHHSDVGGLFRHSLEVAKFSMLKADFDILPAIGHVDEEQTRKPRWVYAAFICGLLHDAGKVLFDVKIHDVNSGATWNPYIDNMYAWSKDNKVDRYRITWRPEHRHKKHENLATHVMDWVLTKPARGFLFDSTDELSIAINHTLSKYQNQRGYLQDAVRHADSASTENDVKTQWHQLIGKRKYPIENQIIKALRRLRDELKVNDVSGDLWIIGGDVYGTYPRVINAIIKKLQEEKIDIPASAGEILTILEDRNLVIRMEENLTYSQFIPDLSHKVGPIPVIKFNWPGLVYESIPLPESHSGILRMAGIRELKYCPDGSIIEKLIEPEDTPVPDTDVQDQSTATKQSVPDKSVTNEGSKSANEPATSALPNDAKPAPQVAKKQPTKKDTPKKNAAKKTVNKSASKTKPEKAKIEAEPVVNTQGIMFENDNVTDEPAAVKRTPNTTGRVSWLDVEMNNLSHSVLCKLAQYLQSNKQGLDGEHTFYHAKKIHVKVGSCLTLFDVESNALLSNLKNKRKLYLLKGTKELAHKVTFGNAEHLVFIFNENTSNELLHDTDCKPITSDAKGSLPESSQSKNQPVTESLPLAKVTDEKTNQSSVEAKTGNAPVPRKIPKSNAPVITEDIANFMQFILDETPRETRFNFNDSTDLIAIDVNKSMAEYESIDSKSIDKKSRVTIRMLLTKMQHSCADIEIDKVPKTFSIMERQVLNQWTEISN